MSFSTAREIVIQRVKKELIGPGSDIFLAYDDLQREIIEGKPLTRYFSGILFPRKKSVLFDENGENDFTEEDKDLSIDNDEQTSTEDREQEEGNDKTITGNSDDEEDTTKVKANQYFPSLSGLTFCLPNNVNHITLTISFGTYDKANYEDLRLKYDGHEIDLIDRFGFSEWIGFNEETQELSLIKDPESDNEPIRERLYALRSAEDYKYRYHILTRQLEKLLSRKIKYQRTPHNYTIENFEVQEINDRKLSEFVECTLPDNLKEGIRIHTRVFPFEKFKYFKIVVENKSQKPTKNGGWFDDTTLVLSKEALNKSCLFQFELKAEADEILPYQPDKDITYLPDEEKMLNFLYRNIKSYAIGHSVAAEWELSDRPKWVKTSYFPQYDLKNQTTDIKGMEDLLPIKELSSLSEISREVICNKLLSFADKYEDWITQKKEGNAGHPIGKENLEKCSNVLSRIRSGIESLKEDDLAFEAFKYANAAIYMQMFHTAKYFDINKGYERYEWNFGEMPEYQDYKSLPYPNDNIPKWRPFQLAFFLLSISSFTNPESNDRELVDLIWFPTGGGKTEAYLAVSAFLIFYRRLKYPENYDGVNIIMRYTLRLLTSQQFERASKLVFACEKIRKAHEDLLGTKRISIGFWVGDKMIPNRSDKARDELTKIKNLLNQGRNPVNKFQVSTCQWCNTKTITKLNENDGTRKFSFREGNRQQSILAGCNNPECDFYEGKGGMSVALVDDDIYNNPPTILFGTVDKFAQLAWNENARKLFNCHNANRPPELIIQDELHLLSGPLGSITGLFENVVLELCKDENQTPKIITSTATVKNVDKQVEALYGRKVSIFPPYGIDSSDSFFSKTAEDSKRRYVGIMPTGKTSTMTQLRLLAALLFARTEISNIEERDNFWTILSYYNSLKDVGKMSNKINSELRPELEQFYQRMLQGRSRYIWHRELTSRIQSSRVKENLDALANGIGKNTDDKNRALDLALATNMISVGLDIGRLGLIVINGMPRNIAEYIQSSSRVARKNEGVVFTLLNPDSSRDLSVFEHFIPFHQTYYKHVEPLSLTPFTDNTFDLLLFTMLVAYYRQKMGQYQNNKAAEMDIDTLKNEFLASIENHIFLSNEQRKVLTTKIYDVLSRWDKRKEETSGLKFKTNNIEKTLLRTPQNKRNENDLVAIQSMRNVEPTCRVQVNQY